MLIIVSICMLMLMMLKVYGREEDEYVVFGRHVDMATVFSFVVRRTGSRSWKAIKICNRFEVLEGS